MIGGGQWWPARSGKASQSLNPGTGHVLAEVAAGDAADMDAAVVAAQTAFRQSGWAILPANDRAVILHRLTHLIDGRLEIITKLESLNVGKLVP